MDTTTKKLDNNKVEVSVTLTAEEVQKEIDAAYKAAGKNRIPGFRPGKAPRKILENHFGGKEYFEAQATDELVRTTAPLASDEQDLIALGSPEFSEVDLAKEGNEFAYSFTIEVAPELPLSSYDPIKIELPSAEPTAEELQLQIDQLLRYNATADEEGNEVLPELTDAWVKETLEFENVDEFKARLVESLRVQKEEDLPPLREYQSSTELAKRLEGEVPELMVKQIEQDKYRDLFQSLQQQHVTLDTYMQAYGLTPEEFRTSMHEQAHDSAAIALAFDAMARHLKLTVSEGEVLEEFEKSGAANPQALYENWRRNGRLAEIRQGLKRIKAAKHVNDTAEVFEPGTLYPVEEPEAAAEPAGEPEKKKKSAPKTKKEAEPQAPESKEAAATKIQGSKEGKEPAAKKKAPAKTKSAQAESTKESSEKE